MHSLPVVKSCKCISQMKVCRNSLCRACPQRRRKLALKLSLILSGLREDELQCIYYITAYTHQKHSYEFRVSLSTQVCLSSDLCHRLWMEVGKLAMKHFNIRVCTAGRGLLLEPTSSAHLKECHFGYLANTLRCFLYLFVVHQWASSIC